MSLEREDAPMDSMIDARGKACPIPVIMAKKEADRGNKDFTLLVDNKTAVENLTRFGENNGFNIDVEEKGLDDFSIRFVKSAEGDTSTRVAAGKQSWAIFIGREGIGDGDPELGESLMKMFFYTLEQGENTPDYVLFMNDGVKVPVANDQAVEHLKALQDREAKILVCGTCLKFYNLEDSLKIGTVSNMYDIAEAMQAVNKVITL